MQVQFCCQSLLEEVLYCLDGNLGVLQIQIGFVSIRNFNLRHICLFSFLLFLIELSPEPLRKSR